MNRLEAERIPTIPHAKGKRVGIVSATFHIDIAKTMLDAAKQRIISHGALLGPIVTVPGAYETPLAASRLLKQKNIDAVVVLGTILQGATSHDEVIGNAVAKQLLELQMQHDKPVGFGITGPRMRLAQARARAVPHARRAVDAALLLCR